jgi:DNA-binding response OmpR family regulator
VPRMRVIRAGEPIELTATEFTLLAAMARQPGRVFTRQQLLQAVHGTLAEAYERAIDAHIKNIRRKLEPREGYIQTVHGVGYRVTDAA